MSTDLQTDTLEVKQWKTRRKGDISIWDPKIIRGAIPDSFKKLDPRVQIKNPVMFVVEVQEPGHVRGGGGQCNYHY